MSVLLEESTYDDESENDNSQKIKSTITGIICDLSASMRNNASGNLNDEGGAWARSLFNVIDDLVWNDLHNDFVFVVGIGAICRDGIFDVLKTIEQFKNYKNTAQGLTHSAIVQKIFGILETGGARYIRKWATTDMVVRSISYDMASLFLNMLGSNPTFLLFFVYECLPSSCRDWDNYGGQDGGVSGFVQNLYSSAVTSFVQASEKEIAEVVEKAKNKLLQEVGDVCRVRTASQIVHDCIGETRLTDDRVTNLMKMVEPLIYDNTPMYKSLDVALKIFKRAKYSTFTKLLFILSDGEPSDKGNTAAISKRFSDADVTIVSCFIDRRTPIESKRLYSESTWHWSSGAQFLFDLSSQKATKQLPRTLFVRRDWKIDIVNNRTKLFLQVNDPENIHDACDLAKNVVCCQETLSDMLVSVSLDMYINQCNREVKAPMQEDESCFANASSTVVHLSMKRILGRYGGYPTFNELRQDIINRYGKQKTNTLRVLREVCPLYRLHCTTIGIEQALKAISEKRPVVATFGLTELEWSNFHKFYDRKRNGYNRKQILTKSVVDISRRTPGDMLVGHAVVLTSYNSECFHFMNSWGSEWADNGFFRVQNVEVLDMKFIDVYWTPNDLLPSEKAYYRVHGGEVADNLMKKFIGLQKAEYKCPQCLTISLVTDFKGTLHKAICPKCREKFKCNESGNILAMNIYLTSMATKHETVKLSLIDRLQTDIEMNYA